MEDRKILVEVTKEELELLQNGFKESKNEEDEQPANLVQKLLDKLDRALPTKRRTANNIMTFEVETIKLYEYSNLDIAVSQTEYGKPKIQIEYK